MKNTMFYIHRKIQEWKLSSITNWVTKIFVMEKHKNMVRKGQAHLLRLVITELEGIGTIFKWEDISLRITLPNIVKVKIILDASNNVYMGCVKTS